MTTARMRWPGLNRRSPLNRGVVAHWPIWEGPGSGTIGDVVNPDPKVLRGALAGGLDPATAWVSGNPGSGGYALNMDNTSRLIPCANTENLEFNDFSFGTWYKTFHDGGSSFLGLIYYVMASGRWGVALETLNDNSGKLRFRIIISWTVRTLESDNALNDGEWHWILCRRSGSTLRMFVDGKMQSGSDTVAGILSPNALFHLGRPGSNTLPATRGPTTLWRRSLAASEIQEQFQNPNALLTLRQRVFPAAVAAFGGVNRIIGGGMVA